MSENNTKTPKNFLLKPDPSGFVARAMFVCAAGIILLAGLSQISGIISIVMLATLVAVVCFPILEYLDRRKWPFPLSLFAVFVLIAVVISGVSMFIPTAARALGSATQTLSVQVNQWLEYIQTRLVDYGLLDTELSLKTLFNFGEVLDFSKSVLNVGVGLLTDFLLVVTLTMFMLNEAHSLPTRARNLFNHHPKFQPKMAQFVSQLRHYLIIKLWVSLLTAALLFPFLWIWLPTNPLPWAFLVLLMNFLPIFGSILAAIPPVLLTLVSGDYFGASVLVCAYLVVNTVVGNILEPRLMGKGLGLSAMVILISLSFWGWMFGLVGLFMAVPLTLSIKLLLETDRDLHWIADLLGNNDNENSIRTS